MHPFPSDPYYPPSIHTVLIPRGHSTFKGGEKESNAMQHWGKSDPNPEHEASFDLSAVLQKIRGGR